MRIAFVLAVLCLGWAACDQVESPHVVEYVADGTAARIDVAFIAPRGIPAPDDTTFVSGDTTFVSGDTTFVLDVQPPWRLRFEADDGQPLYLRTTRRTATGHVSAIIYVDEDYFDSDGSGDTLSVAACGGFL